MSLAIYWRETADSNLLSSTWLAIYLARPTCQCAAKEKVYRSICMQEYFTNDVDNSISSYLSGSQQGLLTLRNPPSLSFTFFNEIHCDMPRAINQGTACPPPIIGCWWMQLGYYYVNRQCKLQSTWGLIENKLLYTNVCYSASILWLWLQIITVVQ